MLSENRLDLSELDAEAADLNLVVDASEALYIAIGPVTGQIPGFIQARAGLIAEGVRDELFRCESRPVQIASGKAISADAKLSRDADGRRLQVAIQNVDSDIWQRAANAGMSGRCLHTACRGVYSAFCRPIQVVRIDPLGLYQFLPQIRRYRLYLRQD